MWYTELVSGVCAFRPASKPTRLIQNAGQAFSGSLAAATTNAKLETKSVISDSKQNRLNPLPWM
jgi:hypothetical protein